MGAVKIKYYVVTKGRGYWRPTKRMCALGFEGIRCGPDGPRAWLVAETWNARWQAVRKGESDPPNAQQGASAVRSESARVYPPGSVGAAFRAYRDTEEWKLKAQSTREKIWWPAWFKIRDMWGDCDPDTITLEQMSQWRKDLVEAHSVDAAHKTLKIWRALWKIMRALKIAMGADPSIGVRNTAPQPRDQKWLEREALHLVKTAWREGYRGLACIIAVSWDSLFSPADVRTLTAKHRAAMRVVVQQNGRPREILQRYFDRTGEGRRKTGVPTIGTVSARTAALIDAYLAQLGAGLLPDAILFRTRTGKPYRYIERLCSDFRDVREIAFPGDTRQLRDMRRAGTMEAVAGNAGGGELASKLANSIDRSNALRKTYAPVDVASVINADDARKRGRKKIAGEKETW